MGSGSGNAGYSTSPAVAARAIPVDMNDNDAAIIPKYIGKAVVSSGNTTHLPVALCSHTGISEGDEIYFLTDEHLRDVSSHAVDRLDFVHLAVVHHHHHQHEQQQQQQQLQRRPRKQQQSNNNSNNSVKSRKKRR